MSTEAKNIIGGEFMEGCTGEKRERFNPATGELVGSFKTLYIQPERRLKILHGQLIPSSG